MKFLKTLLVASLLSAWSCASFAQVKEFEFDEEHIDVPIKGTDTAVVRIGLDEKKMPFVENKAVVVTVGQRVLLVGPEEFSIVFPEASPFADRKYETRDAVMNFVIPEYLQTVIKKKGVDYLVFKYDIVVGDAVLDPYFVIMPR